MGAVDWLGTFGVNVQRSWGGDRLSPLRRVTGVKDVRSLLARSTGQSLASTGKSATLVPRSLISSRSFSSTGGLKLKSPAAVSETTPTRVRLQSHIQGPQYNW